MFGQVGMISFEFLVFSFELEEIPSYAGMAMFDSELRVTSCRLRVALRQAQGKLVVGLICRIVGCS